MTNPRYVDPADGGTILGEGLTVLGPTGARKLALRLPTTLRHIYVTLTGDDALNTGTAAAPFRTVQRAVDELGPLGRGVIHIASGSYVLPYFAGMSGPVLVVGDGANVPGDDGLTELVAATAAGAGSSSTSIAGTFTADAHRFDMIEVLTGAAAGQLRQISHNTTTELRPSGSLSGFTAGDNYRIVRPAVRFTSTGAQTWIQRCGSVLYTASSAAGGVNNSSASVFLARLGLDGTSGLTIADSNVTLYAVDVAGGYLRAQRSCLLCGLDNVSLTDALIAALLGTPAGRYQSCGLVIRGLTGLFLERSSFLGWYSSLGGAELSNSLLSQYGGYLHKGINVSPYDSASSVTLIPYLADMVVNAAGSGAALLLELGAVAQLYAGTQLNATTGDALRVRHGACARASAGALITSSSGNAVNAAQGGRVYCQGDPTGNWSGGGADLRVSATEFAAASTLSGVDATLAAVLNPTGSIITRVS